MADIQEIRIADKSIPPRIRDQGYGRIREWVKREIDKTYGMVMPQCLMTHDDTQRCFVIRGPLKVAPPPRVEPARDATPAEVLGVQLREVRKARGLTQKEVGAALGGLLQADVSSIERGRGSQKHLLLVQVWIDTPMLVEGDAGTAEDWQDIAELIGKQTQFPCDSPEVTYGWSVTGESPAVTFLGA